MDVPEIPNYTLEKTLGLGRHGRVWAGRDSDGHRIAVKILNPDVDVSQLRTKSDRLDLEPTHDGAALQLHQDLDHEPKHIVTELLADPDSLENWSLENRSPRLQADREATWEFLRSLLRAMAWMHRHPIPHGNLKPSNIFLTPDGGVRLTDHSLSGLSASGLSSDGLFYMPPGQLRHPEAASQGAAYSWDVYAFGVEAFRLLTGHFPRMTATFDEAVQKGDDHQLEIDADPQQLAKDLESSKSPRWPEDLRESQDPRLDLIMSCLALDPERRPANANELLARYENLELKAQPSKSDFASQRKARRLWKRATLGWIAASVALAALATWAWRSESGRFDQLLNAKTSSTEELAKQLESEREQTEQQRREGYARELLVRQGLEQSRDKEQASQDRFAAMADLNQQLFDFAMGNQPGASTFLSEKTRRAALREDIRELKAQLPDSNQNRWTQRRLDWYLTQLDFLDEKWTEAEEGLENALAPPDLWPESPAAKVIPWRQLAQTRLQQENPDGAKRALARSFTALKAVPSTSEWYFDQLGRNEWLAAKIASATNNTAEEVERTKAALNAFANAPAGHGSLVYFRKQYLELADLHSMQLEARGDTKALNALRLDALRTLKKALENNQDGDLIYRLGQTQLALAKSAQRDGDDSELKVQLDALNQSITTLSSQPNFKDQARVLTTESLIIRAENAWDAGQRSGASKLLKQAEQTATSIASPDLAGQKSFLLARLAWKKLLLASQLPTPAAIEAINKRLIALSQASTPLEERQISAYRAAMLSDASALLSRDNKEQARAFATEALESWTQLIERYPKQSDYQAMADWTRETLERLEADGG